jgi:prevent-host-death family protein
MRFINVYDAKTHLSQYLDAVVGDESFVICKHGKPIARLVKYVPSQIRQLGLGKGTITMAPDFDELPPDFLEYFE